MVFDESLWSEIAKLLPDDESIKRDVLNDFLWFLENKKEGSGKKSLEKQYIHHLTIKKCSKFSGMRKNIASFTFVNIDAIKEMLEKRSKNSNIIK